MTRTRALLAALLCLVLAACSIGYAASGANGGSVSKSVPFQPLGPLWFGLGSNAETLSGAKTVALTDPQFQILDPGGANRNVTFPHVGATGNKRAGMWYLVYNTADADENLVVKDSAASTIATLNRGEFGLFVVDTGGTWDVAFQSGAYADFGTTGFETDLIAESTSAAGVTIDGLLIKDESIQMTGSGVATGDFDIVLKDNLASALDITEGSTSYLRYITTNSSESIAAAQRLTTTDGVASGTAKVVGGQAYGAVSASDNLLASAGAGAHVDFAQTYSIPASTIKSGTHIKIRSHVNITDASGTDTLEVKLYIGATTLVTTTAFDPDAAADFVIADCDLWSREAPSADSALVGRCTFLTEDGTTQVAGGSILATTDLATNGALVVKASAKWSATEANTNARLEALDVEIL